MVFPRTGSCYLITGEISPFHSFTNDDCRSKRSQQYAASVRDARSSKAREVGHPPCFSVNEKPDPLYKEPKEFFRRWPKRAR